MRFSGDQFRFIVTKCTEIQVEIRLRQSGTKKVHIYKGWKETVPAPKNKPAWMPDKINKPNVKKVGVEKLDKV
jgi:hypothetical protein